MNVIRSATFEGMADKAGFPTPGYLALYEELARNKVKWMITGFMFMSNSGRAMHPGQAGLDSENKVPAFEQVTNRVHKYGSKIIAQLAHTGRQTKDTGYEIVGVSSKKSPYFGEHPRILETDEIYEIIEEFADSAYFAKLAGFDGVQIHGAHGYLVHQFMQKKINDRKDEFRAPLLFLEKVVEGIREKCGEFEIWVKVSGGIDTEEYEESQFISLIEKLDQLKVNLIEVSYGTMDYPLNIFRGGIPLKIVFRHNPVYREKSLLWRIFALPAVRMKIKRFSPLYNMKYAELAKRYTDIPIAVVGGVRCGEEICHTEINYISLCRPFICEPDFILKFDQDKQYQSKCTNCNLCAIMVDSEKPLKCYGGE